MAPLNRPGVYMFYVYILESLKDRKLYIGYTTALQDRVARHQGGLVQSTKPRRPLKLIFYEAYLSRIDAKRREKYLKTTKGKTTVKSMLSDYFDKEN